MDSILHPQNPFFRAGKILHCVTTYYNPHPLCALLLSKLRTTWAEFAVFPYSLSKTGYMVGGYSNGSPAHGSQSDGDSSNTTVGCLTFFFGILCFPPLLPSFALMNYPHRFLLEVLTQMLVMKILDSLSHSMVK